MTHERDHFRLLLSQPVWEEYRTVADWLIPTSKAAEKVRILNALRQHSEWVEPQTQLTACTDEDDNRFLECAVAGSADYLVTKNIRHFPPKEFMGVKIVRIRRFLEVLERSEKTR